jgi:hypothetical protein
MTSRYPRLDARVNNAGALFRGRGETVDGIERTFGLNCLSVFLLTNLLLDALRASCPARVVIVSSSAHRPATIDFADLEARRSFRYMRASGQSKLAEVLFTDELARGLAGSGVTANALHPGFVATNFAKNYGIVVGVMRTLARLVAISPEEGTGTSIYLASSPEVEGVTGKFSEKCREVRSSPASYDGDAAGRLCEISAKMTVLTVWARGRYNRRQPYRRVDGRRRRQVTRRGRGRTEAQLGPPSLVAEGGSPGCIATAACSCATSAIRNCTTPSSISAAPSSAVVSSSATGCVRHS